MAEHTTVQTQVVQIISMWTFSASEVVATMFTGLSLTSNAIVLLSVLQSRSLRVQLTNFFVINICLIGIVATLLVMLPSIALRATSPALTADVTENGNSSQVADKIAPVGWYSVVRFSTTFVAFASAISVVVISVERCFSIRYPMLHSAYMTVGRTLGIIAYIWAQAACIAVTPIAARWQVFTYRGLMQVAGNSTTSENEWSCWPIAFVVVSVCLFFIIPSFFVVISYSIIYGVARRAARQVAPLSSAAAPVGLRVPSKTLRNTPTVAQGDARQAGSRHSSCSTGVPMSNNPCASLPVPDVTNSTACEETERNSTVFANVFEDEKIKMSSVHCSMQTHAANEISSSSIIPLPCPQSPPTHRNHAIQTSDVWTVDIQYEVANENRDANHRSPVGSASSPRVTRSTSSRHNNAQKQFYGGGFIGRKAAVTSCFIVLTFVTLWTPFFAFALYRASLFDGIESRFVTSSSTSLTALDSLELIFVWMGLVTFAINPFVYGFMNRLIRDEIRLLFDSLRLFIVCRCSARKSLSTTATLDSGVDLGGDDPEDFFQFLERTSNVSRIHSIAPPVSPAVSRQVDESGNRPTMRLYRMNSTEEQIKRCDSHV